MEDTFNKASIDFQCRIAKVTEKWTDKHSQPFIPLPPSTKNKAPPKEEKKSNLIGNNSQELCKFYATTGKCFRIDCKWRHSTEKAEVKLWKEERIRKRKEIARVQGDPHADD
jgi:hypothetical protein